MSTTTDHNGARPPLLLLILAFVAVYVVWGSTYLAIRVGVQTLPPFTMAAVRYLVAGALMFIWMRGRCPSPTRRQWRNAFIVGGLMLAGGNGGVTWAEQMIHSGVAALLVATVPLWMVVILTVRPTGLRPNLADVGGLLIGFVGVYVLVAPSDVSAASVPTIGVIVVLCASFCWSLGSLVSRGVDRPTDPVMSTAAQMLAGGCVLFLIGGVSGEWFRLDLGGVSWASLAALAYLIVFGSVIAYTAYMWVLQVCSPAAVGTYAYVNPIVAVFLGWLILDEPVGPNTLVALAMIVAAVVLISLYGRRQPRGLPIARAAPACAVVAPAVVLHENHPEACSAPLTVPRAMACAADE